MNLILAMWIPGIAQMISVVFGQGQRSQELSRGQNCENFANTVYQEGKLQLISYVVCECPELNRDNLKILVKIKGHFGPPEVKKWKE